MEPKPHAVPKDSGWIEVITGCMFSGKTEELIRRLRRAKIAKQKIVIFKPIIDTRYSNNSIVSHSEQSLPSILIKDVKEILDLVEDAQVVGIDEAQFFSNDIINVCNKLADDGKRVIVAGLDMDYRGIPFEPLPQLLSVSEYITKSLAICVECGNPADRTQRKTASSERVIVGAADLYEARCRKCHYIPTEESN
ncbi:MAG: thymidine kinase [Ignavibacteriales bacterium]|nr:thymidine kinase [Ignavibacteriales bacterium]